MKYNGNILLNQEIAPNIFKMIIQCAPVAQNAKVGQFVNVYTKDKALLLPRPISLCQFTNDTITLLYTVVGTGTKEFSTYTTADTIKISKTLGKGFAPQNVKTHVIVGGGIGIAPLLALAEELSAQNTNIIAVLGYKDHQYLVDEFKSICNEVYVSTDKATSGFTGNVVDLIKMKHISGDYFYACGPKPMLKALSTHCTQKNIPVQVSMEERMGCGYGACVGCNCKVNNKNQKVCKDGPVFLGSEVNWQ
ncbi:oxidoreductase [Candidatus Epulonipiscium fishelsonii]|uniref:Oxidoreductase n=1 Tax=Candidatus Epulonipiscium fishelsonii TaxID=77094 RepID=A0ACC8XAZ7_9FIRM|nr:oxidoreductase [Epulopiscium sp. SCG-B05WGA-EpuloA1]ONI39463.1 oxidoreductase [Epulopiscium sp. SCG-B11WGA-EpuloA1]